MSNNSNRNVVVDIDINNNINQDDSNDNDNDIIDNNSSVSNIGKEGKISGRKKISSL